jgi:predicted DNA-binding WGR domain protein
MTHDTRTFDRMGETAQTMVRTSQESARIFTDYTVKAQELNTQLARRAVETWIDGLRKQTELSQEVAQELFGKAEEQADVYRSFFGQWGNVPAMRFPFAGMTNDFMFPFQKQGMRLVETGVRNAEEVIDTAAFPIANYDEKNVDEISARLDGLSDEQIRHLRSYEKTNKNRQSLIERFDSKLRAS